MELSIQPMQWSVLPELQDAPPLGDDDLDCLAEVRDVLARHGKLRRFALHLAHRHFVLGSDEILIEWPDPDGRTQHVTVGRLAEAPDAQPTTWLFEEGPELRLSDAVYCVCVSDPNKTDACIRHGKSRSPGGARQKEDGARDRRISEEKGQHERGFPVGGHDERGRGR
ncbi:hypothetical protein [Mesorhizobium sophorae]|uniref:hypothetical protein n=1 Tax=Mesorhizobium sophorae TaxID=1300294 RepID=UPI00117D57F3|nr:hypothetical protein [Mesorhizobium sophorae]